MWAFVTGLPWWVLILVATVLAYLIYKYAIKKQPLPGYVPAILRGKDRVMVNKTYRDNPPSSGAGG